jgi:hypothetical protein
MNKASETATIAIPTAAAEHLRARFISLPNARPERRGGEGVEMQTERIQRPLRADCEPLNRSFRSQWPCLLEAIIRLTVKSLQKVSLGETVQIFRLLLHPENNHANAEMIRGVIPATIRTAR